MGRPSKLTDDRVERILQALRAGNYLETAARYAGIGETTLHEWRHRYPEFRVAVEKARADAEARNVAVIQQAAAQTWQAAAWWLERSFPARWGRRVEVDAQVTVGLADVFESIRREPVELSSLAAEPGDDDVTDDGR